MTPLLQVLWQESRWDSRVYHVCEPEVKAEFDEAVYDEQVGMMEMVLDVDDIVSEMTSIREQYCAFKD